MFDKETLNLAKQDLKDHLKRNGQHPEVAALVLIAEQLDVLNDLLADIHKELAGWRTD